jgi:DNA helicase HerA-like ATPase
MVQSANKETNKMLYSLGGTAGLNTYTLDVKKLSAYDFQNFTGMGEGSTSILENVIQVLRKKYPNYTFNDIIKDLNHIALKGSPSESTAAIWAKNYLKNLANSGFIGTSEPSLREMISVNQISVVGMSGIKERIQQFVVTNILQRLFNARQKLEVPPLVIIIEEGHRFAPSNSLVSSSAIIRTLATEGRKFGISLVVVSQRPNRLDSTVLSQCVTNIVMKVKNPTDLTSIRESAENVTEDVIKELPKFERGEALVMGEAFPISIRFKVRSDRETKHGGKSIDFKKIWFEESKRINVKKFDFPDTI